MFFPCAVSLLGTACWKVKLTQSFLSENLIVKRKQSWNHTTYNTVATECNSIYYPPRGLLSKPLWVTFFPLFPSVWGGDGCVAPRSLWRNDVDVYKRIPVEYLEDFKKRCFMTISRFYYPQMPLQQLSKADLQKICPALYTKQDVLWDKKAVLLLHWRPIVLLTSHILCLKQSPCHIQRCCV